MRTNFIIIGAFIILYGSAFGIGFAQPKRSQKTIPSNLSQEVRVQVEALYSKDATRREDAITRLGQMGVSATGAVPYLVEMLADDAPDVQAAAAIALGTLKATEAVEPLIQLFLAHLSAVSPEDIWVRQEAGMALAMIGDVRTVEPMIAVLKNGDATATMYAVDILTGIGTPAVDPLVTLLKQNGEPGEARGSAAFILGEIRDERAVEPLLAALTDQDQQVRLAAAWVIGKFKDPRAFKPLVGLLMDQDATVRRNAAISLGQIGDTLAIEPLIKILSDYDYKVRLAGAAWALGQFDDARANRLAVEVLCRDLKSLDRDVSWHAGFILGSLKGRRVVEQLIKALNDEHPAVRTTVTRVLRERTGKDFGEDPSKWQQWWEKDQKGNTTQAASDGHN